MDARQTTAMQGGAAQHAGLWFLDTRVTIRRASADGADGFSIIEHLMPAGESPPLHVHHDEDEVFHVLEGELVVQVGGQRLRAGAGQTLLAPRGVPHTFRVESPAGARVVTVTTGAGFEAMVRALSRPAAAPGLPEPAAPTASMIDALTRECARQRIELVGPPLA